METQEAPEEEIKYVEIDRKVDDVVNSLVIFYINIGQLPPYRAQAYIEKWKEHSKDALKAIPSHVGIMYMAIRTGESRMEICHFPPK